MGIVLFAIIGASCHLGTGYWICYGIYCALTVTSTAIKIFKEDI